MNRFIVTPADASRQLMPSSLASLGTTLAEQLLLASLGLTSESEKTEKYPTWLKAMRNKTAAWDRESMPTALSSELLAQNVFIDQLLASVAVWLEYGIVHDSALVFIGLLVNYDPACLFDELDTDLQSFYQRISVLLMVNYFEFLPADIEALLFTDYGVVLAEHLNLDCEAAVKAAVADFQTLKNRTDVTSTFLSALSINSFQLGKIDQKSGTVAEWITAFYSAKKSVNEFIAEPVVTQNSAEDRRIISKIIGLYAAMVNGDYLLTEAEAKATQELSAEQGAGLIAILSAPTLDKNAVTTLFVTNKDPKAARKAIVQELQTMPWSEEPLFSKVYRLEELWEEIADDEPLVYFDEKKKMFVLNG